jgi:NitT/TauT family transport system permease protein
MVKQQSRVDLAGTILPDVLPKGLRIVLPVFGFFVLLQLFSLVAPRFIMPSMPTIAASYIQLWLTQPAAIAATFLRIIVGLFLAFVVGVSLGMGMGLNDNIREYMETFIKFTTGIPGLSWVLLAIFWFDNIQIRIIFVLFMVLFPWYTLSTSDAIRDIPRDYVNMVKSFRFGSAAYVRKLVLPFILPSLISISKSNIGYAARVVVVAELVGAATGIGKALLIAKSQFRVVDIFAWTFILVTIMLALQGVLVLVESYGLSWQSAGGE